jgi:hypothetical protein
MSAAELTVGKHDAPDGSAAHPLVAAALARRAADAAGSHREDAAPPARESGVGWPGPDHPGGGGLGWPGRTSADVDSPATGEPEPATSRRGWRRFFRVSSAA